MKNVSVYCSFSFLHLTLPFFLAPIRGGQGDLYNRPWQRAGHFWKCTLTFCKYSNSYPVITYTNILEHTRVWKKIEKGFGGYGPFSIEFFLQRIADKKRPGNQKSSFLRMMIAYHQTQRPANSGYSPVCRSWDIDYLLVDWSQNS